MKKSYLIALVVIGIAATFTLWAFSTGMSPYVTIKTAHLSTTPVQLNGIILRDADHPAGYDPQKGVLRFWIQDADKQTIEVEYHGGKPDSFDTAKGTAARGVIRKDPDGHEVFASDSLMLQCDSKYIDKDVKQPRVTPLTAGGMK